MRDVKQVSTGAEGAAETSLREQVYDELRFRLITGKIAPGLGISSRGLALQLGVSQMPVRDALGRLAAEGAVEIRSKRAVQVPHMSEARFAEIMRLPHIARADGGGGSAAVHRWRAPARDPRGG